MNEHLKHAKGFSEGAFTLYMGHYTIKSNELNNPFAWTIHSAFAILKCIVNVKSKSQK